MPPPSPDLVSRVVDTFGKCAGKDGSISKEQWREAYLGDKSICLPALIRKALTVATRCTVSLQRLPWGKGRRSPPTRHPNRCPPALPSGILPSSTVSTNSSRQTAREAARLTRRASAAPTSPSPPLPPPHRAPRHSWPGAEMALGPRARRRHGHRRRRCRSWRRRFMSPKRKRRLPL